MYNLKKSFTLLEIIIALVIISVLSTISISGYNRSREQSLSREAISTLHAMMAAEKMASLQNNGNFIFCQCWSNNPAAANSCDFAGAPPGCNRSLWLNISALNWAYYTQLPAANTVIVFAERQGAGGLKDCQYRMQFTRDNPAASDNEPVPNASCP